MCERSKEERDVSESREISKRDEAWTETGRAFAMADLDRPTGSIVSRPDGRLKVSMEGRAELERLDNRSEDSRGLASGLKLVDDGDGALRPATFCSSSVQGWLEGRRSCSGGGKR